MDRHEIEQARRVVERKLLAAARGEDDVAWQRHVEPHLDAIETAKRDQRLAELADLDRVWNGELSGRGIEWPEDAA